MLKKLFHSLCGSRLERHRVETQCMIAAFEREYAASRRRVQEKSDTYAQQLRQHAEERDQALQQAASFFNAGIADATAHAARLKTLQACMFTCLRYWSRKSAIEDRLRMQGHQYQLLRESAELLEQFAQEIGRASQHDARRHWRDMVQARPPRIRTPGIDEHVRRMDGEMERDDKSYLRELRRIRSYRQQLRTQLNAIRLEQAQTRDEELRPAQQAMRQAKQSLRECYEQCRESWNLLDASISGYFRQTSTESALANRWIATMKDGGTMQEIVARLRDSRDDWEQARHETAQLHERMATVRARIDRAHLMEDFDTLTQDKSERETVRASLTEAKARQAALYDARRVLFERRDRIQALRAMIKPLHPSHTVEKVFAIVSQDGSDLYWKAIGLATKSLPPAARREA